MTRDFSKDLTIMVAGSGNVTMQHLEESMAEWIFGSVDEREVHVIVPLLSQMGGGIRNLIKLGMEWEFKFTLVHPKGAPMSREMSALPGDWFVPADDEREALEKGLSLLTDRFKAGDETAFIHAYDPENTYEQGNNALSDFEIIGDAKNYDWLTTLNLCEGLIDSFEGYKTTDEILKEERLQKEFEDKQRAEEAANPKPVAAKKVTAPRKRAAKQVEKEESKPLVVEDEKPLEDAPAGTVVEVAGTEFVKVGPNPFREPLPTGNILSADVKVDLAPQADVWTEVNEAHAQTEKSNRLSVSRDDLAQLSTDIRALTSAFGNIMDTFTQILKDG